MDYQASSFDGFPDQVRLTATAAGRLTGVIWTQQLRYAGVPLWTSESYSPLAGPCHVGPGQKLVFDVKCSQVLYDDIAKHGGQPIMWKAGHSLIKGKMKETGALLGGEMSGHLFLGENWYGFDDALFATVRLLEIVAIARGCRHVAGAAVKLHALVQHLALRVCQPVFRHGRLFEMAVHSSQDGKKSAE